MKTILITGGSYGLGCYLASKLSKDNKVIILGRTENLLKENASKFSCDYFKCDLTDCKEVKKIVNSIINKYKKIDILINCAGLYTRGSIDNTSYEEIQNVINTNVLGTIYITKEVIKYMKDNSEGHIITINSREGLNPKLERSIYVASKFAIRGFMDCLELECKESNIKISNIYPGAFEIGMKYEGAKNKRIDNDGISYEELFNVVNYLINTKDSFQVNNLCIKNINN
jgi:3-oxoacyl-[acyl-carrier protein] reductase